MEDRLRKYARVVETGSFTQASRSLHISQPALSTAIRKLESELKSDMFVRRLPPLKLTAAGESAYRYAKSLDARSQNFRLELAEINRQKPSLAIGLIDSMAQTLFEQANVLPEVKKQAHISLHINNSRMLLQQLQQGELDMALLTRPLNLPTQFMRIRLLGSEPLVAVTSPENTKPVTEAISHGSLPGILSYDKNSHTDRLIEQHFMGLGIEPKIAFRSTSPDILLHLAISGEGTAILPYLMVRQAITQQRLVMIGAPIARPIVALEHKDKTTPLPLLTICNTLQRLLEHLNAECADKS